MEGHEALCTLRELEARHIARAVDIAGGNQRRAARLLGITRWSLARRLRKLGLVAPADVPPPVPPR